MGRPRSAHEGGRPIPRPPFFPPGGGGKTLGVAEASLAPSPSCSPRLAPYIKRNPTSWDTPKNDKSLWALSLSTPHRSKPWVNSSLSSHAIRLLHHHRECLVPHGKALADSMTARVCTQIDEAYILTIGRDTPSCRDHTDQKFPRPSAIFASFSDQTITTLHKFNLRSWNPLGGFSMCLNSDPIARVKVFDGATPLYYDSTIGTGRCILTACCSKDDCGFHIVPY
jgi:hypothetical protein